MASVPLRKIALYAYNILDINRRPKSKDPSLDEKIERIWNARIAFNILFKFLKGKKKYKLDTVIVAWVVMVYSAGYYKSKRNYSKFFKYVESKLLNDGSLTSKDKQFIKKKLKENYRLYNSLFDKYFKKIPFKLLDILNIDYDKNKIYSRVEIYDFMIKIILKLLTSSEKVDKWYRIFPLDKNSNNLVRNIVKSLEFLELILYKLNIISRKTNINFNFSHIRLIKCLLLINI